MKDFLIQQIENLQADGIDFVSIQLDDEPQTIYCSYTYDELKKENIFPKSDYKFYKIINGEKKYI